MSIVDLDLDVQRRHVLPFLDYPEGRSPPARVEALLVEVLVEARALVGARGAWLPLRPEEATDVGLPLVHARGLAIGVVTAGWALEARVSELLAEGELSRAVILDAAGSAAAEEAADRLGALITGTPYTGDPVECRVSPGYGDWPLESQVALLDKLPAAQVGVRLEPSMLMIPRKSISFAMELGALGSQLARGCHACALSTCRYRRAS